MRCNENNILNETQHGFLVEFVIVGVPLFAFWRFISYYKWQNSLLQWPIQIDGSWKYC